LKRQLHASKNNGSNSPLVEKYLDLVGGYNELIRETGLIRR